MHRPQPALRASWAPSSGSRDLARPRHRAATGAAMPIGSGTGLGVPRTRHAGRGSTARGVSAVASAAGVCCSRGASDHPAHGPAGARRGGLRGRAAGPATLLVTTVWSRSRGGVDAPGSSRAAASSVGAALGFAAGVGTSSVDALRPHRARSGAGWPRRRRTTTGPCIVASAHGGYVVHPRQRPGQALRLPPMWRLLAMVRHDAWWCSSPRCIGVLLEPSNGVATGSS